MTSLRQLYPAAGAEIDLAQTYAFPAGTRRCVRAVFVSSVDGAATINGHSGGLGNTADKTIFALLRGLADVVLVGAGTARAEHYGPVEPTPIWGHQRDGRPPTPPVAVVSRSLTFDLTGPLFTAAPNHARTIVLTCQAASDARVREVSRVAEVIVAGSDRVDPAAALDCLTQRGYRRITCEGGPRLLAQIAQAACLDELCLTLSPLVLAGSSPRITNGPALANGLHLDLVTVLEDNGHLFLRYALRGTAP
jgi:riboflavin biosynthesis pyrimidine reductase